MINEAVILAAGEGARMRPLTYARPKGMLPIANRPILEHLLTELRAAGIRRFVFVVGYHEEEIRKYFGSGEAWQAEIKYIAQQKQLGTADAINTARDLVQGSFMVANGDVIIRHGHLLQLIERADNMLLVYRARETAGLGVIETEGDRITRLHEKTARPPTNLINAGVYLFSPAIFQAIADTPKSVRGEYEITDAIQRLIDDGAAFGYHEVPEWSDLSFPWDLLTANEAAMRQIEPRQAGKVEANATLQGKVAIGENSLIRSGVYITGPVMIGRDCDIGPNCYLRAGTTIGDRCHIGAGVEIKNAIIMNGTKIPHQSYVGDSIIGQNCNLGAGTKIANLRFDKKTVRVGDRDTKRRKLGAIIGDGVQTGINAMVDAGCLIGDNAFIGPGAVARGSIGPGTRIW